MYGSDVGFRCVDLATKAAKLRCEDDVQMLWRQKTDTFTHTNHLRNKPFTHKQTLLHPGTFTHSAFYTENLLHTDAFYTQALLHTEAFTQRPFHRQKLSHTQPF